MKTIDDAVLREWVERDLDGELGAAEQAALEQELARQPALAAERRELAALCAALAKDRVAVRADFADRVMAALPEAAWERQCGSHRVQAWALPLVLALVLGGGAALLLSSAGAGESHALGIALAVADFFEATFLAGAGLLFATWRGVGLGLAELFAESGTGLVALAVFVLCLDLLFLSLLRRRRAAPAERAAKSEEASRSADER